MNARMNRPAMTSGRGPADLGQVEGGGDAERHRQGGRDRDLLERPDQRVTDAAAGQRGERPGVRH